MALTKFGTFVKNYMQPIIVSLSGVLLSTVCVFVLQTMPVIRTKVDFLVTGMNETRQWQKEHDKIMIDALVDIASLKKDISSLQKQIDIQEDYKQKNLKP